MITNIHGLYLPLLMYYVAFVYRMGNFEGDIEEIMEKIDIAEYPTNITPILPLFEQMA